MWIARFCKRSFHSCACSGVCALNSPEEATSRFTSDFSKAFTRELILHISPSTFTPTSVESQAMCHVDGLLAYGAVLSASTSPIVSEKRGSFKRCPLQDHASTLLCLLGAKLHFLLVPVADSGPLTVPLHQIPVECPTC